MNVFFLFTALVTSLVCFSIDSHKGQDSANVNTRSEYEAFIGKYESLIAESEAYIAKDEVFTGANGDAFIVEKKDKAFIDAISEGDLVKMKDMLKRGANINAVNEDKDNNIPALHLAIRDHGDSEIVRELLARGADIHMRTPGGWTPLHRAAYGGWRVETVKTLLELGADVDALDMNNRTPLHEVSIDLAYLDGGYEPIATASQVATIQTLINRGASVDARDKWQNTPLYSAISCDNIALTRELLAHGANVNAQCEKGRTPLIAAVRHKFTTKKSELISMLIKAGADVNIKAKNGKTALSYANDKKIRKLLMKAGAKK